jgi:murein DD-endopeptidase MepM/ murein hydrolase activator NlpD
VSLRRVLFLLLLLFLLSSFIYPLPPGQDQPLPLTPPRGEEDSLSEQGIIIKEINGEESPLEPESVPELIITKKEIHPGDYLVVRLENLFPGDEVHWSTDLAPEMPHAFSTPTGQRFLFPVSYWTKPGTYSLNLLVTRGDHYVLGKRETLTVGDKEFPTQHLRVSSSLQALRSPELLEKDAALVRQAKSVSSSEPMWEGPFLLPVEGRISTEFGLIRYINGVESGRHSGLDIAVPRGTPVLAANSGVVSLALPLYVSGHTVIIDHGLNLFSAYSHLDKILVRKGEFVKKGETIGLVGSTGFSTGPHLHWTISVESTFINPWLLLAEDPLSSTTPGEGKPQ